MSPGRDRDELDEEEACDEEDVDDDAPLLLPTEMTECGRRGQGRSPSAGGTDGEPRRRGPEDHSKVVEKLEGEARQQACGGSYSADIRKRNRKVTRERRAFYLRAK